MSSRSRSADRRFARETGVAREIADLAEPVLEELGFRLVRPAKVPTADEMYDYWHSGVEEDDF